MTSPFTAAGLRKAREMLANIPPSHRNLLIESMRSTCTVPRTPIEPVAETTKECGDG